MSKLKVPTKEHHKLSEIAGRWTIQGMEDFFLEVCEMYDGGYFLVCNSELKTESGEINKGVSIIGYSDETKNTTYYHYSSTGVSQTLKGIIDEEGNLYFEGEEIIKGKLTKTRVSIKKSGENYDFKEETSLDGEMWKTTADFCVCKVKVIFHQRRFQITLKLYFV